MICFCKKTFFCTLLASISNDWHQSYFPPVFKLLFYLTFPVKSLKCALKLLTYEFFQPEIFFIKFSKKHAAATFSNFEVFFTLFLAQFSQQKKKFTKAVSEPFARLIIRYSRRLWKVFRKGVSSLLDWSPIQGWWWKGWSYPFGIIWTHFHLLWYGVSEVYLISKFPKKNSELLCKTYENT